jgi:hypothetical protein
MFGPRWRNGYLHHFYDKTTTTAAQSTTTAPPTTTTVPATTTTVNPFALPEWLGTRLLPLRTDGHGEVQPT